MTAMVANVITENLAASTTSATASRSKRSSVISIREHQHLLLQPSTINFSCHEIPELFLENLHVHFWITRLTTNPKIINTLPVMTVFQVEDGGCGGGDKWYTYNNSLLYVYRVLNFRGIINEIQVKVGHPVMQNDLSVTGCHVVVQNTKRKWKHCVCGKDA